MPLGVMLKKVARRPAKNAAMLWDGTAPDWQAITGAVLSGFTAGLLVFGAADGTLTSDATLSYSGGVLAATSLKASSLTSGRIPFATTAGLLTDSANLTYSAGTLSNAGGDIAVSGKFLPNNSVSAYLNSSQGAVYGSTGAASFPFNQSGNVVLEARGGANPRAVILASAGGAFSAYLDAVGTFNVPSTTASTTTSSGAVVIGNGSSGGLGVGGAIHAGGGITVGGNVSMSNAAGAPTFTIDDSSGLGGQARSFIFANSGASSKLNWQIGCQITINDAFEIIPSTLAGGAIFSAPVFALKTGSVILGAQSALATNATDGFAYMPTCAGTPTGTPSAYTGKVAWVYDTTNHKICVYDGGAWKQTAALT